MDIERLNSYNKEHCWQYDIRLNNLEKDIKDSNLSNDEINNLRISNFKFSIAKNKEDELKVRKFIEKHEWLGEACGFSKFYFMAHYKGILAGVIIMGTPNAYNYLLGKENKNLELLINRGASISWSPKNLASSLMSYSLKWIVKNTEYRMFSAYSDPTARELGTIYQACNFYYLGQFFGSDKRYIQPYTGRLINDRWFRTRSTYKKFALLLGIEWKDNWLGKGRRIIWNNIPNDIKKKLKDYSKMIQKNAIFIETPKKHKYIYVLGRNKTETKQLRKLFLERNKFYEYPKKRVEEKGK